MCETPNTIENTTNTIENTTNTVNTEDTTPAKGKKPMLRQGIDVVQEIEQGTLRVALLWDIEKRVSQLFIRKQDYRKELFRAFAEWIGCKDRTPRNIKIVATQSESVTGQPFTLSIPQKNFVCYSLLTWVPVKGNFNNIPKMQPVIVMDKKEDKALGLLKPNGEWDIATWCHMDVLSSHNVEEPMYYKALE